MTRRRASGALVLATLAAGACELTPPVRPNGYEFRSQPDNLVFHWPAERMPVRYWVEAKGALPDYVDEGIRQWEAQFLYGEFDGRVADSATADVRVFLPGNAPPSASLTDAPPADACSGQTTIVVGTNNRLTVPISITLQWFAGFTAEHVANCLARVTTHEVGHSLGLLRHSDQATDLMFGAPFGNVQVRAPSQRDRASVQNLYHTTPDLRP